MVTSSQKKELTERLEWSPSEVRLLKPSQAHSLLQGGLTRPTKLTPFNVNEIEEFINKLPPPTKEEIQEFSPSSPPDLSNFTIGSVRGTCESPLPPSSPTLEPLDISNKYEVVDDKTGARRGIFSDLKEADLAAEAYRKNNPNVVVREAGKMM